MTALPTKLRLGALPTTRVARGSPADLLALRGGTEVVHLTTGAVAKMLAVAPRTVSNWVDRGHLRGERIPGSRHRRILATALFNYLASANAYIPESLRAMCVSRPELVLYRCPAEVGKAVESAGADADITAVESPWELAKLFARPHKAGVIVCGDGAARSEIEDVFRHRPAGWLRVHVRGDDQEPAAGADVSMAGDDLTGLLGAVAKHLLGGRS